MKQNTERYRRKNKESCARAARLVARWHSARVDDREQEYATVNSRPVSVPAIVSNPGSRAWRPEPRARGPVNKFNEEIEPTDVTARGVDTRSEPTGSGGSVTRVDVVQADYSRSTRLGMHNGSYEHDGHLSYAKFVMRHVHNLEVDLHRALEMNAAGYIAEDIADQLGCSERQARVILADGLSIVSSLMRLRPLLQNWY